MFFFCSAGMDMFVSNETFGMYPDEYVAHENKRGKIKNKLKNLMFPPHFFSFAKNKASCS